MKILQTQVYFQLSKISYFYLGTPVDEFSQSLTKIASKIQELQTELINFTAKFNKDPDYQKEKLVRTQPSSSKLRTDLLAKENKEISFIQNKNTSYIHTKNSISAYQTLRDESIDISINYSTRPVHTIREPTQSDEDTYDCITSEILQKLKTIFRHYSRSGDKSTASHLKLSKYRKMINDCAGLVDSSMTLENLELYFTSYNKSKNGLDFEAFLELLAKISYQKYSSLHYTNKEALQCLLEAFILPLYDQISTEDGRLETELFGEKINEEILTVIKGIYPVLIRIYKEYFAWENKRVDKINLLKAKSEEGFWAFLRDFEIYPGMITKTLGNSLWSQILDPENNDIRGDLFENDSWLKTKDVGILFKFTKFCQILVKIAFLSNKQPSQENKNLKKISQVQQFISFLERMEFSRGMAKFAKQGQRFIPKQILEKVFFYKNFLF